MPNKHVDIPGGLFSEEEIREYEELIYEAMNKARSRPRFTPSVLLENTVEAFMTWCVTYFPHRISEWEDWQVEPIELMVKEPRALVMVPAGTMKTTVGATLLPIWRICQNHNYEILGVFKDDNEAKKTLRSVKKELLVNPELIRDFGPFYGKKLKWNEHEIEVAKRTRNSKSPTLCYMPYGGQTLGSRFHIGFVDDCVTRDMAMSARGNQDFIQWLASDFETGPYAPESDVDWEPNMMEQIVVYGTRWNNNDGYALIEKRNEEGPLENPFFRPYKVCVVDIIKDEAKEESISKRWPWPKLMAKKAEMQEPMFSWRMRNRIVVEEMVVFKEQWLRGGMLDGVHYPGCRDSTLSYRSASHNDRIAIGYDPQSGSTTRWAKYAAIVAVGLSPNNNGEWSPYIFDWWKGQTVVMDVRDPDSQINRLLDIAKAANLHGISPTVVLEDNATQGGFREPILSEAQRRGVNLSVAVTRTGGNKYDPEVGIENAAIDFQNGWCRLPFALPADMDKTIRLEAEFINYGTSKFSDVVMAWWFARNWLYNNRFSTSSVQYIRPHKMPRYMQRRLQNMPRYYKVVNMHSRVGEV